MQSGTLSNRNKELKSTRHKAASLAGRVSSSDTGDARQMELAARVRTRDSGQEGGRCQGSVTQGKKKKEEDGKFLSYVNFWAVEP